MKNFIILFIVILSTSLFSQNWLKVDSIFAVSGVTVKSFSAPEFADLNNDGNPDLILGNIDDAADFFGIIRTTFQRHSAKTHQFFILFITADK